MNDGGVVHPVELRPVDVPCSDLQQGHHLVHVGDFGDAHGVDAEAVCGDEAVKSLRVILRKRVIDGALVGDDLLFYRRVVRRLRA